MYSYKPGEHNSSSQTLIYLQKLLSQKNRMIPAENVHEHINFVCKLLLCPGTTSGGNIYLSYTGYMQ